MSGALSFDILVDYIVIKNGVVYFEHNHAYGGGLKMPLQRIVFCVTHIQPNAT